MGTTPSNLAGKGYRFGIFEVDLAAGELRKNGARVKLQDQPFQVLVALLEKPAESVTREELRQRIWPADTFVDFDHSLNTAVNKVREALGDSAANPRYIETLARRGYRFIAPVHHQAVPAAILPASAGPNQASLATEGDLTGGDLPKTHRGVTRLLFALIQVMYLAFYLVALFRLSHIDRFADVYIPGWDSVLVGLVLVSAGVGIPLRCYLLSGVGFDHPRLGDKFARLFSLILPLDTLWAFSPFLLLPQIGIGGAFAATAALLYVPFSERSLVRMTYGKAVSGL
jgi:DNA-binding winged helix-turn-helix (wHTH) protein